MNGVFRCFQAYRLEPLICGDYSNIPPVQLHRFDSKQAGYTEAKPSKTGQAAGKWGGLFRVGFSRQKTEEADASSNGEENMDEDDVVVVHNAASADKSTGKLFLLTYGCAQGVAYQTLTIYTRNPEILLGKSNGLRHSVWEAPENVGCDSRGCNFSTLSSLLR